MNQIDASQQPIAVVHNPLHPWWLRVDWLSCKTLQAMIQWAKCLSEGVCSIASSLWKVQLVVLLPESRMRTCRKELFGSLCWSWEARKHCVVSNSNAGREGR